MSLFSIGIKSNFEVSMQLNSYNRISSFNDLYKPTFETVFSATVFLKNVLSSPLNFLKKQTTKNGQNGWLHFLKF